MERGDLPQTARDLLALADKMGGDIADALHGKDIATAMAVATGALTLLLGEMYGGALVAGLDMSKEEYSDEMREQIVSACEVGMKDSARFLAMANLLRNTGQN